MSDINNDAIREQITEALAEEFGREPTETEVQTHFENESGDFLYHNL